MKRKIKALMIWSGKQRDSVFSSRIIFLWVELIRGKLLLIIVCYFKVHIALTQHAFGGERRLSSFKVQYDKIRK